MMRELRYWDIGENHGELTSDSEREDNSGDEDDDSSQKSKIKKTEDSNKISDELLIGLKRLKEEGKFFDVTIIVGKRRIQAHKIILCAASPYFNAMFTGSFIENNHNEVTLQDTNEEMVELIINYMYSGELPFDSENVDQVLLTAQFLQVDSAVNICMLHIKEKTSLKNCLSLILFAGKNSLKRLCESLLEFIAKNFDKLFANENFSKIEYLEFKKLINDKRIIAYPPDIIVSVIFKWVNYNYETRCNYLDELLEIINPQHITKEFIESKNLLKNIKDSDLTNWISKEPLIDVTQLANWDIAVFKHTGYFTPELYKLNSEASANLQVLPREYFDGSYISYGGAIYHTGGCISKRPVTNETQCLSIYKNIWKPFVNLNVNRAYHRNCIVNTNLYSIGGTDGGYSAFTSCEYIDLVSAQSISIGNLIKPREAVGLSVHNNVIYAIGGRNRGKLKYNTGERYDPREGIWVDLNSISYGKGFSSCAAIDNYIYCLTPSKSLERYDIRANAWTQILTQYNSYPIEFFTINNELYGLFKDNICVFDSEYGRWKPPCLRFRFETTNIISLPVLIAPILRPTGGENENVNVNENINENESDDENEQIE